MRTITTTIVLVLASTLGGCAGVAHEAAPASVADVNVAVKAPRIVEGDLTISNRSSLDELAELEIVTGTLTIEGNTRLQNLEGLENLRAVGGLVVRENLSLATMDSLANLRHAKTVSIVGNPRLENLHGLESLKEVDRLVVTKNGIFCTSGLNGLERAGEVIVSENPRLLSLRGLANLRSARDVTIAKNPRLVAESGMLQKLNRVSGDLTIQRNASLDSQEVNALVERLDAQERG
jgi:hypothetical protein